MTTPSRVEGLIYEPGAHYMPRGSYTFSLPAGYSCPFAGKCYSKVPSTGTLVSGPRLTCHAASEELTEDHRRLRWHNYRTLQSTGDNVETMAEMLIESFPDAETLVLHRSGDFFSQNYFTAWMLVASARPGVQFLVQTTSISYWLSAKNKVPGNVKISANLDTTQAAMVKANSLPFHGVVFSHQDAEDYGLPVETKLNHLQSGENYVTLVRGIQEAGTPSGNAVETLRTGRALDKAILGDNLPDCRFFTFGEKD